MKDFLYPSGAGGQSWLAVVIFGFLVSFFDQIHVALTIFLASVVDIGNHHLTGIPSKIMFFGTRYVKCAHKFVRYVMPMATPQ